MQLRFLVAALMMVSVQSKATVLIDSVKHLSNSVSKYSKFEVKVASDELKPAKFYNPYDSSSVDMYAIFTAPSGKQYRRNAFWYEPYTRFFSRPNNVVLTTQDSCDSVGVPQSCSIQKYSFIIGFQISYPQVRAIRQACSGGASLRGFEDKASLLS